MSGDRRDHPSWQPAARPAWITEANAFGNDLDIDEIIPLDAERLITAARHRTGLDDFGSDDWREPFEILTRALNEEARLNLVGRLLTSADLLANLEARLRVEETYRRHPEIDEERIVRPLVILGQPRTGTTALQNVLAADPDNGTIRTFEAWFPAPLSDADDDDDDDDDDDQQTRIELAAAATGLWNRVTPELRSQHEVSALVPTECNLVHGLAFRSRTMVHLGQIPSYNAYMARADMGPAFEYHRRVLKLLQYQTGTRRWVLKSPDYLTMIPQIIEHYPDVGLIFTHRDPVKAFGSAVSLIGTLQWQRSDTIFQYESPNSHVVNRANVAALLSAIADMLESGSIRSDQLVNVPYQDIVRDPLAVVRRIYEHFSIPLAESALQPMAQYVEQDRQARRQHEAHIYSTGTAEDVGEARELFRRYQTYFDVPNEI